ncbi:MAG TPA: response regulator [Terriglobales bacterium]|nr:response regulator [Bryobacteraceae bacterium]HTR26388.1 response regulator [Terriglobales bacterium]
MSNPTESRILVVDDRPDNLRVLEAVLEYAGYTDVHCLNDSRDLLSVFESVQPDLVLLDLHMPHVDGIEAMDRLATVISEGDYLPVLVLTGDNTLEARQRALKHGASDFLQKPLNRVEVELRVRNLLETRRLHLRLKTQNTHLEQQTEDLKRTNQTLRETQTQLIHSEKMAGLGQLVAGIAHEINNPLAFVVNNLFIIREKLGRLAGAGLPEELAGRISSMQTRVEEAEAGALRVKDLVAKLRTFSRLDEGTVKTVDIHESIESVLLFLRHKLDGRIDIRRNYGDAGMLTCYAGELNQVLMNVIANAIDAIEGRGSITLTTGRQNGQFFLSVRDTGKGIPAEIGNRVFDPFFTTKAVGEGTGLGLAISYGIVKAHKGSMEFSSTVGQGTEFVVRIPVSLGEAA